MSFTVKDVKKAKDDYHYIIELEVVPTFSFFHKNKEPKTVRYYGSGTVWHNMDKDFARAGTGMESMLADILTKYKAKESGDF